MLLKKIHKQWQDCQSDFQRERFWRALTCPSGLWLQALREFATAGSDTTLATEGLAAGFDAHPLLNYSAGDFSAEYQQHTLLALLRIARLVNQQSGTFSDQSLQRLATELCIAPGLIADIVASLTGEQLRHALESTSICVLLVNDENTAVPATLTLESVDEGSGEIYPIPELLLCRDDRFRQAERLAASRLSGDEHFDIRWKLDRLDGKAVGHLTGPSMGAAFAAGIRALIEHPFSEDSVDLQRVAVCAAIDDNYRLLKVGSLWGKLGPDAVQLAGLHTLVIAAEQTHTPPAFLDSASRVMLIQAESVGQALNRLQMLNLPARHVRDYESAACEMLEYRLSGTQERVETHYSILPLYRKHNTAVDDAEGKKTGAGMAPSKVTSWEDTIRQTGRHYSPVTLEHVFNTQGKQDGCAARLLFLGPPGSGKTTLIQYLTWSTVHRPLIPSCLVPARIRLQDWERWSRSHPEARLVDYLCAHYRPLVEEVPDGHQWERWLHQGKVLLMLDGINEIGDDQWLRQAFDEVLAYSLTPIVATSRTVSIKLFEPQFRAFSVYWLGALTPKQRNTYIHNYPARHGFDREELIARLSQPSLDELASLPLLLSIICFTADKTGGRLPTKRADWLSHMVDALLLRPSRRLIRYPSERPPLHDRKTALASAALHLFQYRLVVFTGRELTEALTSGLERQGYAPAKAWGIALERDLVENSGLLRGYREQGADVDDRRFFIHPTIQQSLCAHALAQDMERGNFDITLRFDDRTVNLRQLLDDDSRMDDYWSEVIALLKEYRHTPTEGSANGNT